MKLINKLVLVQSLLLIIFFLLFIFIKSEIIMTLILSTFLIISLIYRMKGEIIFTIIGIVLGIILEVGGDKIYKLQYWNSATFLGIPLWLPILWGFGFLLIGRINRIIVKSK